MILSDIDGLYTADPRTDPDAVVIPAVTELTEEILAAGGGSGSALGTGGMATKLSAARICMDSGVDMAVMNGRDPEILYDAAEGKPVGTRFIGRRKNG